MKSMNDGLTMRSGTFTCVARTRHRQDPRLGPHARPVTGAYKKVIAAYDTRHDPALANGVWFRCAVT